MTDLLLFFNLMNGQLSIVGGDLIGIAITKQQGLFAFFGAGALPPSTRSLERKDSIR
jgi:hypothetical protein